MIGPILSSQPVLRYASSTVNIVFEGNSLVAGNGATVAATSLPGYVQSSAPVNNALTVNNQGVNGWTIDYLAANTATINALYVEGKKNVLVIWEGTNSVFGSSETGLSAAAKMQSLVASRLNAHPWLIVLMTTLPRESTFSRSGSTLVAENNQLIVYDNQLRANWKTWGAKALVDVRQAGSPFANVGAPYADADFLNIGPYWVETGSPGYKVHLNDAGYLVAANMVSAALRRLPAR